jgi:TetR/AcrR family transcriptional regulator, acrAB operon repressor
MYVNCHATYYREFTSRKLQKKQFMARKTKAQALETRCDIIHAAIHCFSLNGVATTSLNDIAKQAGVTRGAIYWHFKNKLDLLSSIWLDYEQALDAIEEQCEILYPDDPLAQLRNVIIYVLQSICIDKQHRALMEILYHKCEFTGEMSILQQAQRESMLACYPIIEKKLRLCQQHAQLPRMLQVQPAAVIIRAYISGLIENWLFSPESFALEPQIPYLADTLLDMLKFSPTLQQVPTG